MATLAPAAAPTRTATPALTLEERLTLSGLAMNDRLGGAGVQYDVRTAHIEIPDVEISPPILVANGQPIARLLERAAHRLATGRWSRHTATDSTGAICPLHAIHLEAGSDREEGEARTLLLQAIRVEDRNVVSIPYWNSRQSGSAAPIRMLQAAARLA
ncbi:hypothetical protein ACIQV3_22640 [Streptomyces sp. NPDC099050]|uniref:DUF6197 family protein n=1 Tax=Streptomyces sp. NPDC099050 TaxID=3366100 RepID=UPI00380157B0